MWRMSAHDFGIEAALGLAAESRDSVVVSGPVDLFPSRLPAESLCVAAVRAAARAAQELTRARGSAVEPLVLDSRRIATAARSERFVRIGSAPPASVFDPLSRFVRTADGWVRLHGNYSAHREAALTVLGYPADQAAVDAAAARWKAVELEDAVVAAGGCAAAVRTEAEWAVHAQGVAASDAPLLTFERGPGDRSRHLTAAPDAAARGVRVLDLTRVIAGPVAARMLAALGADVIRVDPPGRPELALHWWDTMPGRRSLQLDLAASADRSVFDRLLAEADVVLLGYRPGGLARLGLGAELSTAHPGLVLVSHDAWGWGGPWLDRRGFDSLVQAASGISVIESTGPDDAGAPVPGALPAQALDHATGYLIAAAACLGLARRQSDGHGSHARLSLAQTAAALLRAPRAIEPPVAAVGSPPELVSFPSSAGEVAVAAPPWGHWGSGPPEPGTAEPKWRFM
jgi:hypothetical protein